MTEYQNSKIYTIRCHTDKDIIYVGSTTQPLNKRWGDHKKLIGTKNAISISRIMEEKGLDNFYIELFENYPCNNKEELRRREGQVTRDIGTVNIRIECRTKEEYYQDNREKIQEKNKKWIEENKEYYDETRKKYREENKESKAKTDRQYRNGEKREEILQKKRYRLGHLEEVKEKSKQYRLDNAEEIKRKKQEYYQKNKERLLQKFKENYKLRQQAVEK
jgi:hypothetical protein